MQNLDSTSIERNEVTRLIEIAYRAIKALTGIYTVRCQKGTVFVQYHSWTRMYIWIYEKLQDISYKHMFSNNFYSSTEYWGLLM